jgi:hypothetical protein
MPCREIAEELLLTAERDLRALENMLNTSAFDDSIFGFHVQ